MRLLLSTLFFTVMDVDMQLEKGIAVITGNGKGKTTTALGYVLRFLGDGKKVRMVQFLKGGGFSGELFTEQFFAGRFKINQFGGSYRFSKKVKDALNNYQYNDENSDNLVKEWAEKGLLEAREALRKGYDLIVLDEVAHALRNNLLAVDELKAFLLEARAKALIIATGRTMHKDIIDISDYVVECYPVKHPREQGIGARRGIEY